MVYSIALRFLRDPGAAEELAQDVFLELHLRLGQIESEAHAVFWLRKVTSRRCIDETRRNRYRPRVPLDEVPEPFSWMPARDPLLEQYMAQLVASLPEHPRMIVILRYQEDLAPAEIAEILEMPVATVKSHLQRALALLRRKMEASR